MKRLRVIGLTGGIASGKSTVARQFAMLGCALYDADKAVHALLGPGGRGVAKVAAHFPGTRKNDEIDRTLLGEIVFRDAEKLRLLETILHPLVWEEEKKFLRRARAKNAKAAILEIPLLFESGRKKKLDAVIVTHAPKFLKKRRALKRPGMSEAKLAQILLRQTSDHDKKRRADHVVHTGLGRAASFRQVKRILAGVMKNGVRHR